MQEISQHITEEGDKFKTYNCCANSNIIITDNGSCVCSSCGVVHGEKMVGLERRAYTSEEVRNRKRTEPRWRNFGPRTIIQPNTRDHCGNKINTRNVRLFTRLSKIQASLITSLERNYWESRPKLNQLSMKLHIPDYIIDTAWQIYTEVAKQKLTMGRSINAFICASIYASIRIHSFPRLLEEIGEVSFVPIRSIHKSLGLIVQKVMPKLDLSYRPISPFPLIFRFGNELDLTVKTQKQASRVLYSSSKNGLNRMGKDPKGIAAACLYIASKRSGEKRTQREIAEISHVTEVTLRTRAKQIKQRL